MIISCFVSHIYIYIYLNYQIKLRTSSLCTASCESPFGGVFLRLSGHYCCSRARKALWVVMCGCVGQTGQHVCVAFWEPGKFDACLEDESSSE